MVTSPSWTPFQVSSSSLPASEMAVKPIIRAVPLTVWPSR